ncbi:MAG: hypothetical protein AB7I27_13335 [Bacteriovoracaceae bacterium]
MAIRLILVALFLLPTYSFGKVISCSLSMRNSNPSMGGCYSFQDNPYIILFNQWDSGPGCDEVKLKIDLDQAKISMTPYKDGVASARTSSTQSRVFVVEDHDSIIINYNPGARNTIAPLLILLQKDFKSAVIYWMYQHNGDEKYGPFQMSCGL